MAWMRNGLLICLFLGAVLALKSVTTEDPVTGHKIVSIRLGNFQKQMAQLQQMQFDVAGVDFQQKIVDVVVHDNKEMQSLRRIFGPAIAEEKSMRQGLAPDSGYHTFQEVENELQDYAAAYPEITSLESIGKSVEGRDIWAIKISDNASDSEAEEPSILFNAMHHSREVMTTEVAIDTVDYLLTQYGTNDKVTTWVDNNEIWVVPMLNVDGNHKVWNGDAMWRKNTKGGFGVDINRNYPYKWNSCGGSSGSVFSQTYRGPRGGSEPETQALMNFVSRIKPVFNISYHSYSEMVIYPFGCRPRRTPTGDVVEAIGAEIAESLPADSGSGRYVHGTPWELLYNVDGGDIDWMYHEEQVIPYVIELNGRSLGFQPSFDRWRQKTVVKLRSAWGLLLDKLEASGIRGLVQGDTVVEGLVVSVRGVSAAVAGFEQDYRVNPDRSFHLVLNPGTYQVELISEGRVLQEKRVDIGANRLDMVFAL